MERFIKAGNTVNLCAIDLSKAFDKVNHHALLVKLMKRKLPVFLIDILENWFNKNLAIANRSRVSCAHNTSRAFIGLNITP